MKDIGHKHHNHNSDISKRKKRFIFVIILNLFISVVEIISGVISGSMALISDAFHNFEDTASLIVSYIAWLFSFRESDYDKTYGYKRFEVIAAFSNSLVLIISCLFILFESIKRFLIPEPINSNIMITVSVIAFIINVISALSLHTEKEHNINWRSSYLHLIGDAGFSLAVVAGAFFIKKFHLNFIDPLLSTVMSLFIIYQTYNILKKSFNILMESSPEINYDDVKKEIENINGVKNIHHIHSWMVNEDMLYFEAHIEVDDCLVSDTSELQKKIEDILTNRFRISHITLQFEIDKCKNKGIISC